LAIVSPGDAVGLAFGQRATIVVRLATAGGLPLAGGVVMFAIAVDLPNESAGGSTLGTARAETDATGMARVDVVAGAAATSFRVRASASGSPPAFVTITVGDTGFSTLEVVPQHLGMREPAGAVEVRLYRGGVRCADLPAEAPPSSPYPPRSAPFDGVAAFDALSAESDYAVLAWVMAEAGIDAAGCVDLAPRQLRAGARATLVLPVAERPLEAAVEYQATSSFDLLPARQMVFPPGGLWARAGCARGAAEVLLDCAIDALDDADPLDCMIADPGVTARRLLEGRGEVGADGCRDGGPMSPDARLTRVLTAAPAPGLPAATAELLDLLDTLSLESTIALAAPVARQTLGRATLERAGTLVHTQLIATARPLLAASAPALRPRDSDELQLGTFAYTLRLGDLAARAMEPALGDVHVLGQRLAAAARAGTASGCPAISMTVCPLANLPAECLADACAQAVPAIDALLAEPFTRLDGDGVDFMLEGSAVLMDADRDFAAEQLLGGSWTATARLASGEELRLVGVFQATAR
jgi:hypothetical protein